MTGLDNIIAQILDGGKAEGDRIIAEAKEKAKAIKDESLRKTDSEVEAIRKKGNAEVAKIEGRIESANDLYRRTQTLKLKQDVISEVIDKAYEKVSGLDAIEYFDLMEKLIEKYAQPEEGIIFFSEKDLGRIPGNFEGRISRAAEKAGGKLTLSRKAGEIENGFVLVYDGIEENCTIRSIFDQNREAMQDEINELLYRKEG